MIMTVIILNINIFEIQKLFKMAKAHNCVIKLQKIKNKNIANKKILIKIMNYVNNNIIEKYCYSTNGWKFKSLFADNCLF